MDRRRDKCPEGVKRRLRDKRILTQPENGMISVEVLDAVLDVFWTDEWYVRRILKRYSLQKRRIIATEPSYNKVDRYILKMFMTPTAVGEKNLTVKKVATQIKYYFGVDYSLDRIRKIRRKSHNSRAWQKVLMQREQNDNCE